MISRVIVAFSSFKSFVLLFRRHLFNPLHPPLRRWPRHRRKIVQMEWCWRQIGPFRGGRALAIEWGRRRAGHVLTLEQSRAESEDEPMAAANWIRFSNKQPISSIGAIASRAVRSQCDLCRHG